MLSFDLDDNELNADWFKASRLLKKNTDEAKQELERMEATPMVPLSDPFPEDEEKEE